VSLSAAEAARLDTWMVDIAIAVRGEAKALGNGDWRIGANGALVIHADRSFHDFSASQHSRGALGLLKFLHAVDSNQALERAQAWLKTHAGDGRLGRDGSPGAEADGDDLDQVERSAMVAAMWERGQPIAATPVETYLASRGLKLGADDAGGR
jgi:hypothetical protein